MRRCPSRTRSKKPTLIACRTIIGLGAPTKAGTAGDPWHPARATQEAAGAKAALGWHEPPFTRARRPAGALARGRQPRRRRPAAPG